jgi:acetoin utilization deacetylase AcuC-like enzyme
VRVWSHADFPFPLPAGHKYPLAKYALLRDHALAAGHDVDVPGPVSWDALLRVHDAAFVARMRSGALERREARVLGLPWSAELVERAPARHARHPPRARDALRAAGSACMLGGGHPPRGRASARGYCLFNDLAVVTTELRREGLARARARRRLRRPPGRRAPPSCSRPDPDAFSLSSQCERNYPFTRIPSDLDVELPARTGDDDYLAALDGALAEARRRFGTPDLVLYLAAPTRGKGRARAARAHEAGLRARDAWSSTRRSTAAPPWR